MEAEARKELIEVRANPTEEGAAASTEVEAPDGSAEETEAAGSEMNSERAGGLGEVEPAGVGDQMANVSPPAPELAPDSRPDPLTPLEPPETDAPEMSALVQGIEDRADESGGAAAQRVATLSYSFASEIPGGLLDVTT
jgi:hypothetical protein